MDCAATALVGLGAIGAGSHLPALLDSPGLQVRAVADRDPARLAAAAVPDDVERVADLDALLGRGDIVGLVLATPPWVTPQLAVRAARAGLFVLAEKPIAESLEAAAAYTALSEAEQKRIQVGLTYRHHPAMQRLRSWIAAGRLGSRLLVRAHIYDEARSADPGHSALIEETLRHGTPVMHEGSHVLDWIAHLLGGAPRIADAWSLRTREALPADNLVGARLRYGPHTALVEFGWFTDSLPGARLSVIGDRGTATLDVATFALTLATADGSQQTWTDEDHIATAFRLQAARFAALIAGAPAEPSLSEGMAALRQSALIEQRAQQS